MNKLIALMLLYAALGLGHERRMAYVQKRNTPEIIKLERSQAHHRQLMQDVRALIRSTPVLIGGVYVMYDVFSSVAQAEENNLCLACESESYWNLGVGALTGCVGFYSMIDVCDRWCPCCDGCTAFCSECAPICCTQSCQLLNYFSCNAVYQLIKMAQEKLTR